MALTASGSAILVQLGGKWRDYRHWRFAGFGLRAFDMLAPHGLGDADLVARVVLPERPAQLAFAKSGKAGE